MSLIAYINFIISGSPKHDNNTEVTSVLYSCHQQCRIKRNLEICYSLFAGDTSGNGDVLFSLCSHHFKKSGILFLSSRKNITVVEPSGKFRISIPPLCARDYMGRDYKTSLQEQSWPKVDFFFLNVKRHLILTFWPNFHSVPIVHFVLAMEVVWLSVFSTKLTSRQGGTV